MMAPEEILGSADASRRDFLKKVLAGSTFAAPVIATFSMEGLSPERAWGGIFAANQCSNMPSSECCHFAAEIARGIIEFMGFIAQSKTLQLSSGVVLLGPLGKAQALMANGLVQGSGDCLNEEAVAQFVGAQGQLNKVTKLAAAVCDPAFARIVASRMDEFIEQITDLVNGNCAR
jgi:hypothetical protein